MQAGQVAVSLVAMICATNLAGQDRPSTLTSLCAIAKQPAKFEGRSVTVRTRVLSDGTHGALIYDESCADFGLTLLVTEDAKGFKDLESALSWCLRGTLGKFIVGRFTGMIHFGPRGHLSESQISVRRIEDLTVKSTQAASTTFQTQCPDSPPLEQH